MKTFSQFIAEDLAYGRSRSSWNDRFAHWEKPASDTEEAIIERVATTVRDLLAENLWLAGEGVSVYPQGSYFNNTNVRRESDIDLRVEHPGICVRYSPGVDITNADAALGFNETGRNLTDIMRRMRTEIFASLSNRFGEDDLDVGTKAITIKALPGVRAAVDVVPCFTMQFILRGTSGHFGVPGVAIQPTVGNEIWNFPVQHHNNGVGKRSVTKLRFKRVVRILKRMRDELVELRKLRAGQAPSFFIESLAYAVEDDIYLFDDDDRYDRVGRVLKRMDELLTDLAWVTSATEINGLKILFHSSQSWTSDDARDFVRAAIARLGA